eukprot:748213-Hanusia_phi.AAC.1
MVGAMCDTTIFLFLQGPSDCAEEEERVNCHGQLSETAGHDETEVAQADGARKPEEEDDDGGRRRGRWCRREGRGVEEEEEKRRKDEGGAGRVGEDGHRYRS